jgi:hypothetical protein
VVFDVGFGGFRGVVRGVMMMAMRQVRVMRGEMMIAGFVMARGFAMMPGSVLVVFGCFVMMLGGLLGHKSSLGFLCGRLLGGRRLG